MKLYEADSVGLVITEDYFLLDIDHRKLSDYFVQMMLEKFENLEVYTKTEVAEIFNCSESKAANIIRALNDKLIDEGVPKKSIVAGKVSKKFFHETLKI